MHDPTETEAGHVDETFERAGERFGAFVALAGVRLQSLAAQASQAAQSAASRAGQGLNNPAAHTTSATDQEPGPANGQSADASGFPPTMERAEQLVDTAGQQLSELGQSAGQRFQMLWARLKEEGEDIVAEAQALRRPDAPTH